MKRRVLLCALALILLSAAVLSGCSRSRESVYLLNGYPEMEEALLTLAKRYEKEAGVQVRVVTVAKSGYENTLNLELNHFGPPALFLVNARTAETWREFMLDLTDTDLAKARTTRAFDLTDEEGRLLAVGWGDRCLGLAVNPVLLEKAGHRLDELYDFDSLRRVCQDIHARTDILGFEAFASADLGENAWRLTDVLFGPVYAREMEEDPVQPSGDSMEHFRTIWELAISNSPTVRERLAEGSAFPREEFLRGKAVFLPSDSAEYETLSAAVPEAEMIPVWCGMEGEEERGLLCHIGDAWAVNANLSPSEQKNALALLKWLFTDAEASAVLTEHLGILPFRTGATSANGFLRTAAADVTAGRSGASPVVEDRTDPGRFRKNLTDALRLYGTDPTEENWAEVEKVLTDNK